MTPLLKKWRKMDYLVFFILLPVILVLIYSLPPSLKSMFILDPKNPTILSIYFSNYTHSEFSHLIDNLVNYLFIIFLLFNVEVNRELFYTVSLLNFTMLPILSSLLVISLIPNVPPAQGFSAVVSAFIGYFLYSVYMHIKSNYYQQLESSFFGLLIMVNFLVWSIFTEIRLLVLLLPITLYLGYANMESVREILIQIKAKQKQLKRQNPYTRFYNVSIFLFTIFFMFSFWTLIPSKIIVGRRLINIFAHYTGYCFGAAIPFLVRSFIKC